MPMKRIVPIILLMAFAGFFTSCKTTHPNEKLIVGEWKPVKVEKYFTEEEQEQLNNMQTGNTKTKPVSPDPNTSTGNASGGNTTTGANVQPREGDQQQGRDLSNELQRLIRAESRANIIIYPDKTAAKFYRGRTVKATWKLRRNGTVFVAKDLKDKKKYRIDILSISDNTMEVVENLPVGGIKILYKKAASAEMDEYK